MGKGKGGIVTTIAAVAIFAPVASAGNTEITISEQGGDFSGKVKSSNGYCVENRTVKLLQKQQGKDQKIATDTSGMDGEWSTGNTGLDTGRFYAKVKALASCDSAKSKTIKL